MRRPSRARVREVTRRGPATPATDQMLELDAQLTEILGMLDRAAAVRRMLAQLPGLGVDIAWVGEPNGGEQMVLRHVVNSTSGLIEGLVVPVGTGLGGQVLAIRRPLWVSDYCAAADISPHFKHHVSAEGIKAMIALPIIFNGRLLGVLYGANRRDTAFGDRVTHALEQVAARTAAAAIVAERAQHAAEVAVHEERRRLTIALDDTVGAILFTLSANIRSLRAGPDIDHELLRRLSSLEQQAVEAAAALRGSLCAINVPPEQVALGVAVRERCRAFQDRTGTPVRLLTLDDLPPLDTSRVGALADAAREGLLNVEKHAQAGSVLVSVFATGDGVAVTISDDGVGLPEDLSTHAGLGLTATAERLAQAGGALTISPNEDGGVTFRAWLPA